jgi:hypothetical protein
MNIYRALKLRWSKPPSSSSSSSMDQGSPEELEDNHHAENLADPISNVVQLAPGTPLDVPAGLSNQPATGSPQAVQPRGLMEAPELQAFFADNHFGLGKHNGAQYKNQDALQLGCQNLVSKFQNTLELLIAQKQARADGFHNMALQTEGVCTTTTGQLHLACQRLERDMATLHRQSALSADGKGWALSALNDYQIGFRKGLREAVDMQLMD